MEKRNNITLEAVLLAALLALSGLSLFAAPPAAPEQVTLTGWLHVEDHTVADMVLSVEVDDDCLFAQVESNGRFTIIVPVGATAMLTFQKPGHLTKEVTIDTRNAMNTRKAQRTNQTIKFDVVMEPEAKRPGRKYDGPVGGLTFFKGTGTIKVKHDLRVVADEGTLPK